MTLAKYTHDQREAMQQKKGEVVSHSIHTPAKTPRFMKVKRMVKTALLVIALNGPTKTLGAVQAETNNDLSDILESDLVVS